MTKEKLDNKQSSENIAKRFLYTQAFLNVRARTKKFMLNRRDCFKKIVYIYGRKVECLRTKSINAHQTLKFCSCHSEFYIRTS